jgi:hypothetical protein
LWAPTSGVLNSLSIFGCLPSFDVGVLTMMLVEQLGRVGRSVFQGQLSDVVVVVLRSENSDNGGFCDLFRAV